jgi:hypothetical protein
MNAMRIRIVPATLVLVIAWTLAPAQSHDGSAGGGAAPTELAGIQRSLDRLVDLFEAHLEHQRVDLLLKRIQLKERRLEPAERRLRDAEGTLEGRKAEIKRMKAMLAEQRTALDDEIRDGTDQPESETRRLIVSLERVIRTEEAQLGDELMRVRLLDDDLAGQREEIEILDDLLLEMLEDSGD